MKEYGAIMKAVTFGYLLLLVGCLYVTARIFSYQAIVSHIVPIAIGSLGLWFLVIALVLKKTLYKKENKKGRNADEGTTKEDVGV